MDINRIFIIGFRTTGKTTLAKILAEKLKQQLVETDEIISLEKGMSIDEITKYGTDWEEFRKAEHKILKELIDKKNIIVSTGGGMPVNNILDKNSNKTFGQLNSEMIISSQGSVVILLTASNEIIEKRIIEGDRRRGHIRPILDQSFAKEVQGIADQEKLKKMVEDSMRALNERKKLYEKIADLIVDTGDLNIAETVDKILKFIKEKK